MAIISSDQLFVLKYGSSGQETVNKMTAVLQQNSLDIQYNSDDNKFIVLNSALLNKTTISNILCQVKSQFWQPQLLDETDGSGNRLLQLKPVQVVSKVFPEKDFILPGRSA